MKSARLVRLDSHVLRLNGANKLGLRETRLEA